MRVALSDDARRDLRELTAFGAGQWGADRAADYVNAIRRRFRLLSDRPLIGAELPDRMPPIRHIGVGSHIIFYRIVRNRVLILRVLHQSVDVVRHLR